MDSDNETSIALSRLSLSIRSTDINKTYIVRDVLDFYSGYCKLRCNKSFYSIEVKTMYKNNKIYIKTVKLEVWKKVFILVKCIYCIYKVLFKLYNELFRYFKNRCVGTILFAISPETSSFETSFEPSSLDPIHRMLDIPLLIFPFALVFEQEYIVIENKLFE